MFLSSASNPRALVADEYGFHGEGCKGLRITQLTAALPQLREIRAWDALCRLDRHVPRVHDVDFARAIIGGQARDPERGLMLAEIDQPCLAVARHRDAHPRPFVERGRQAVDDVFLHDLTQEGDALPALSAQNASFRPPQQVLWMGEALAVSRITAARHRHPKPVS